MLDAGGDEGAAAGTELLALPGARAPADHAAANVNDMKNFFPEAGPVGAADPAAASDAERERSQGYALLHETLTLAKRLPLLSYVKFESDPLDELLTRVGNDAGTTLEELDQYAASHPQIDLEHAGLPEVEQQRRELTTKAIGKDLLRRSGSSFEVLYLIAMADVLNQSRHILAALETRAADPAGQELAGRQRQRLDADYQDVSQLLETYFK